MRAIVGGEFTLGPWHTIGPFPRTDYDNAWDAQFGPEADMPVGRIANPSTKVARSVSEDERDPSLTRRVTKERPNDRLRSWDDYLKQTYNDGKLKWRKRRDWEDGQRHHAGDRQDTATYAYRLIRSPVAYQLPVVYRIENNLTAWLNGRQILRGHRYHEQSMTLNLRVGDNHLLIKNVGGDREPNGGFSFNPILPDKQLLAIRNTRESDRTAEQRSAIASRFASAAPSSSRGGLVSMAGVHQWGSDGNRTKPVERGKYILDVLFNDPPDPPPLVAQSDRFLAGLAEKMFIYAASRTLHPSDQLTIDKLVAAMKKDKCTPRSLLKAVVRAKAFQLK